MGNHEQMMLDAYDAPDPAEAGTWWTQGGSQTADADLAAVLTALAPGCAAMSFEETGALTRGGASLAAGERPAANTALVLAALRLGGSLRCDMAACWALTAGLSLCAWMLSARGAGAVTRTWAGPRRGEDRAVSPALDGALKPLTKGMGAVERDRKSVV